MRLSKWLREGIALNRFIVSPAARVRLGLELLDSRCLPSGGALDPTFGAGAGYVATSVSQYGVGAEAVLIQPDQKIIAVGSAALGTVDASPPDVFAVVRYKANGNLDTTFGSGGHAFADFPGAAFHGWRYSFAWAAALYPQAGTTNDGKIVAVGEHDTKYGAHFVLARFNTNGTLDSTFGSEKKNPGEVTTIFPTNNDDDFQKAFGVVVLPNGKIVAAGMSATAGGFVLARYKANGDLDTTFGTGGEVITPFAGGVLAAGTLLMQPDGKLIVAGETHPASQTWVMAMARYNANGSLDTSFGTGGLVTSSVADVNSGVEAALYPPGSANAGKIVVVGQTPQTGTSGNNLEIARFNTNGTLDSTFGSGGTLTGPLAQDPSVVIAADSKIVVSYGSKTAVYGTPQFGVARFNADGSPDGTFGTNGYVRSVLGGYSASSPSAVALQSNGDIVVAGAVFFTGPNNTADSDVAVARYLPSAPQIGSFKADSNPVPAGSTVTLTAANISDGNPNSTVAHVEFFYFDSNGNKVSLGTGQPDTTGAWTLPIQLSSGTYTLYAQAEDSYGVFGDPVSLALEVL